MGVSKKVVIDMKSTSIFNWLAVLFVGAALGALAASAVWHRAARRSPQASGLSTQPQGSFPGLKISGNDFLIPLNRLVLTPFFSAYPDESSGRNRPATVVVFGIREGECTKYFLVSGIQGTTNIGVKYLGADLSLESAAVTGNGYYTIEYSTWRDDLKHQSVAPLCLIVGAEPETKNDISQPLKLTSDPEKR